MLELFLIREITHVVTDREGWTNSRGAGSLPKTPNETFSNGHDEQGSKRGRPVRIDIFSLRLCHY